MQDPLLLLNQISDELNKDLNPDKMLQRVIDLTVSHFKAATGSIMLFDENNRVSKYILQQQNLSDAQAHKIVGQVLTEGFAGWVLKHKCGDIITDTRDDDRWLTYPNQPYTALSVLAAPLIRRKHIVGILTINHATKPNHFKKQDLKLLTAIAGQAAIALENAQLFRQTELERATLSAVINSSHDVIIVTHDDDEKILLLNPAAEEILQVATSQWHQKPMSAVTQSADIVTLIRQAAPEASIECCNGKTMTAGVIDVPDVGKLTLMHDISALKALDKLKTEFVTAFTHDLSAPLGAIKSYLHVVPVDGPLTERQAEDMEAINAAVDQMRTLIRDLLELTQLENMKDFRTCDISLQETIQNSFGRFRQVASTKEIGLSVYTEPQALITHGSPSLIARAVDNLVENALKYTRPNGKVNISLLDNQSEAYIKVEDTGIGISEANLPQIFDKFFRAHKLQQKEIPGSGLGLSIVKAIVERHGGRIWAESQPNRGSAFTIALPIQPQNGAPGARPAAEANGKS